MATVYQPGLVNTYCRLPSAPVTAAVLWVGWDRASVSDGSLMNRVMPAALLPLPRLVVLAPVTVAENFALSPTLALPGAVMSIRATLL